MKILILNGPNLNLLGTREKGIYGERTFDSYLTELRGLFPEVTIDYYQSNIEGELIDAIHSAVGRYDGIVLNAGGYTHTSVALADAVGGVSVPVVEVHISCILAREEFRHISLLAPKAKGSIMGFGLDSYRLGILSFLK
ncbi:MAG: type II 3-dehydroquinate dehydratase [Rikenellaceae bacterium]|jgi:3-dehydroquinate dehydratase-2|nr:type II 3-dehydroquinate dehydratase [Rikenellaceae bacterium]